MTTRAKEIMTTELILAHQEMSVGDAIKSLVNNRITGMPVVDKNRHLIGVVSEYDIIKSVDRPDKASPLNLDQQIHFSSKVSTVTEETGFEDILKLFIEKKVRRLPVVNAKNELVGIITRRDIMRVLFYRAKKL